ncbi:MAG TPA: hypothetical protein DDY98_01655 [Ruminococcaceae bacterium]|nr:hypothetical protein [Oscillospiraceae bacterium]
MGETRMFRRKWKMRYEGEMCPYCGNLFADGDDIVVCPECATPHHRACWFAHGHCANEEKHGTDFVWKKTEPTQPESQPEEPQQPKENNKGLDIVCPDCGKVSPNGTLRCPDCGALLVPFITGEPPIARFREGFDPNEELCGMKSGDIALYCRTGGTSYIKKCRKCELGQKLTFNWAAFLFSPFWFFYRKLYKPGAVLLGVFIALTLAAVPFEAKADKVMEEVRSAYNEALGIEEGEETSAAISTEQQEQAVQAVSGIVQKNKKALLPVALFGLARFLGIGLISGCIADALYIRRMKKDITTVRENNTDERTVQAILFRKGGASLLWGFGSYLISEAVFTLFSFLNQ